MREIPVGADDLYPRLHRLAGRLVDDSTRQPSHLVLLSCLFWGIPMPDPSETLWYRKGGASGTLGLAHGRVAVGRDNATIATAKILENCKILSHSVAFVLLS